LEKKYIPALYNSYLLLKKYPENRYLINNIAKCLYGLAKFKSNFLFDMITPDYENIQGHSQALYFAFESMTPSELASIGMNFLWKTVKKHPDDLFMRRLFDKMLHDVFFIYELESYYIQKRSFTDISKIEDIYRVIFTNEFNDQEFMDAFNKVKGEYAQFIEEQSQVMTKEERKAWKKLRKENEKEIENEGIALGIKELVIVAPEYKKYTLSGDEKFVKSEEKQLFLSNCFKETSDKYGMNNTILDQHSYNISDVLKYNQLTVLNDWFSEQLLFSNINMISMIGDDLYSATESFESKYYLWSGVINYKLPRDFSPIPKSKTALYGYLFDIESGVLLMKKTEVKTGSDHDSYIRSEVEDILFQIQNER
jgi:hypothetical protein